MPSKSKASKRSSTSSSASSASTGGGFGSHSSTVSTYTKGTKSATTTSGPNATYYAITSDQPLAYTEAQRNVAFDEVAAARASGYMPKTQDHPYFK